jgi:cyanophycinase
MRSTLSLCCLAAAVTLGAADHDYHLAGNPADVRPAATRGGLLLSGGGGNVESAFRWFVAAAGGGDIVVLRASGGATMNDYLFKEIGGVDSVETIVFHDRRAATDPRVLEVIARADGIFIAGGDQARYVNFWRGTPVAEALAAHVRAGRPLGGTSAGLAVQGEFLFSANFDAAKLGGELESRAALRNPQDPRITLEPALFESPLMRGVITDSHFMERRRLGRLIAFLSRLQRPDGPVLLGLGIDERTALCVEPDGTARVHTANPAGRAWFVTLSAPAETPAGRPLVTPPVDVVAAGPESTVDLPRRHITKPAAASRVRAVDGRIENVD